MHESQFPYQSTFYTPRMDGYAIYGKHWSSEALD